MIRDCIAAVREMLFGRPIVARASFLSRQQRDALAVLSKHGIEARSYHATIGSTGDNELWNALCTMQHAGYLMFRDGDLVGAVGPTDSEMRVKPKLRLIVDNDGMQPLT